MLYMHRKKKKKSLFDWHFFINAVEIQLLVSHHHSLCFYLLNIFKRQLLIFILNLIFKTGPQRTDSIKLPLSPHISIFRPIDSDSFSNCVEILLNCSEVLLLANFPVNDFSFSPQSQDSVLVGDLMDGTIKMYVCVCWGRGVIRGLSADNGGRGAGWCSRHLESKQQH